MTRLPGAPAGQAAKFEPDVYSALLLIGVLFLLTAIVCLFVDLTSNYGLSFGQLFSGAEIAK